MPRLPGSRVVVKSKISSRHLESNTLLGMSDDEFELFFDEVVQSLNKVGNGRLKPCRTVRGSRRSGD